MRDTEEPMAARWHQLLFGVALACALIATGRAFADVSDVDAGGFTIREAVHVNAGADKIYAVLIAPQNWWSSKHTFSGSAANMSLDARAGGCWCETLPNGGSVLHLTVVNAVPGKLLRMKGALGPFQSMAVDGVMTWSLAPAGAGTDVTLAYAVAGYTKGGFTNISQGADAVLGEQAARLKLYVETGSPESAKDSKP